VYICQIIIDQLSYPDQKQYPSFQRGHQKQQLKGM